MNVMELVSVLMNAVVLTIMKVCIEALQRPFVDPVILGYRYFSSFLWVYCIVQTLSMGEVSTSGSNILSDEVFLEANTCNN